MGGWGDDCVEWGKLYLGKGCCEDTEQEAMIFERTMAQCEHPKQWPDWPPAKSKLPVALAAWASISIRWGQRRKALPFVGKGLAGQAAKELQLSASRNKCNILNKMAQVSIAAEPFPALSKAEIVYIVILGLYIT